MENPEIVSTDPIPEVIPYLVPHTAPQKLFPQLQWEYIFKSE